MSFRAKIFSVTFHLYLDEHILHLPFSVLISFTISKLWVYSQFHFIYPIKLYSTILLQNNIDRSLKLTSIDEL